mgnify:CR=1 FL=1
MYRIRPARDSGQPSGAVIPNPPTAKSVSSGKTPGQKSLQKSCTLSKYLGPSIYRMNLRVSGELTRLLALCSRIQRADPRPDRQPRRWSALHARPARAASQVAASLAAHPNYAAHIQAPCVSADGRSALVTFQVPGNVTNIDQAVTTLQHAVAGVQARHPDLRVAETGDATIQQAIDSSLNFGKTETTSVPITLILLLGVFSSLVAAGIPVVLALTALTAAIGGGDDGQPLASSETRRPEASLHSGIYREALKEAIRASAAWMSGSTAWSGKGQTALTLISQRT